MSCHFPLKFKNSATYSFNGTYEVPTYYVPDSVLSALQIYSLIELDPLKPQIIIVRVFCEGPINGIPSHTCVPNNLKGKNIKQKY